jgi:hypothetical protein
VLTHLQRSSDVVNMSPTHPEERPFTREDLPLGSAGVDRSLGLNTPRAGGNDGLATAGSGQESNQTPEQDSHHDEHVLNLISRNATLEDVASTLRDEIAELRAAYAARETAYHREREVWLEETTALENTVLAMGRTIDVLQAENRALEEETDWYKNHVRRLPAGNDDHEAERTTFERRINNIEAEKCVLTEQKKTLHSENSRLKGLNNALRRENESGRAGKKKLERENKLLNKEVKELNEVHADVLPLVRDQYAIALRTLVDGVLHLAGWNGALKRADFIWATGPALLGFFGNAFTLQDIVDIVL